ncbi:MAG: T9SS type A sorting domain-containing protein [Bacteroidia bacterium]|nr:T9SS type A sorting domain-containing protein [Bacteroidia bacterium]
MNSIHGFGITDVWACGNNGKIIYRSGVTSIFENQQQNIFSIYPNPTTQNATLEFDNSKLENCSLTLYDSRGQLVRTINNIKTNTIEIERQNLANGLYFFQLNSETKNLATGKLKLE